VLIPPQKTWKKISSAPPKQKEVSGLQSDVLKRGMVPNTVAARSELDLGFQGVCVDATGGGFLIPLLAKCIYFSRDNF
jgi:hypothetical protein